MANLDEFTPITKVADFVTLLGTYSQGFSIIVDPYPEAQGQAKWQLKIRGGCVPRVDVLQHLLHHAVEGFAADVQCQLNIPQELATVVSFTTRGETLKLFLPVWSVRCYAGSKNSVC